MEPSRRKGLFVGYNEHGCKIWDDIASRKSHESIPVIEDEDKKL